MKPDFKTATDLLPAIIQDSRTGQVLMLGYMNSEAYEQTIETGYVTFYSRSRQRLWQKGETSGNSLQVMSVALDCDRDTLLVQAVPHGPVCHTGAFSCFGDESSRGFLHKLESVIEERKASSPDSSYTARLLHSGTNRIAQKVGEEAVEVVIASKDNNTTALIEECADLLYHLQVLLSSKGITLAEVESELLRRHSR